MEEDGRVAALRARAECEFLENFGRPSEMAVAAPGRVNLIGEHTDYNAGFVLPMAIERYTIIVAARRAPGEGEASQAQILSTSFLEPARITVKSDAPVEGTGWTRYVQGVVSLCVERGLDPGSFDAVIASDVPLGSGLSSSASLEVAMATLMEALCGTRLDALEKAELCQRAERRYAGVPCGIMDQMASACSDRDQVLLIDCRSNEFESIGFTDPSVQLMIIDSGVRHSLADGEYARRRQECAAAAERMGVASLRDVSVALLEQKKGELDDLSYRRARHVITENVRTRLAADALREANWVTLGALFYESHASLRDDFEVSCSELDALVTIAKEIGSDGGVFGARMTGGGFGGSTVWWVASKAEARIRETLRARRQELGLQEAALFTSRPARGAYRL